MTPSRRRTSPVHGGPRTGPGDGCASRFARAPKNGVALPVSPGRLASGREGWPAAPTGDPIFSLLGGGTATAAAPERPEPLSPQRAARDFSAGVKPTAACQAGNFGRQSSCRPLGAVVEPPPKRITAVRRAREGAGETRERTMKWPMPQPLPAACDGPVDNEVRAQVWGLLAAIYHRHELTDRRRMKHATRSLPHPPDPVGRRRCWRAGETVVVVGRHLSESGSASITASPLPYRRVIASLETPSGAVVRIPDGLDLVPVYQGRVVRKRRPIPRNGALAVGALSFEL